MRIISGIYGGRKIVAPRGRGVRPTLERVREAIFDSTGSRYRDAVVLDLFAGSGAMGFEAVSRGAKQVFFVDSGQRSADAVLQNARTLSVPRDDYSLMTMTAPNAIKKLARSGLVFDVVFVDPPWESGLYEEVLLELSMAGIVRPGGIVIVEHARRFPVDAVYGPLNMTKDRTYGDTGVAYFVNTVGREDS